MQWQWFLFLGVLLQCTVGQETPPLSLSPEDNNVVVMAPQLTAATTTTKDTIIELSDSNSGSLPHHIPDDIYAPTAVLEVLAAATSSHKTEIKSGPSSTSIIATLDTVYRQWISAFWSLPIWPYLYNLSARQHFVCLLCLALLVAVILPDSKQGHNRRLHCRQQRQSPLIHSHW